VLPEAQDVLGSRDALLLEMGDTADLHRAEILGMYRSSAAATLRPLWPASVATLG
jgi:hypothetical protein